MPPQEQGSPSPAFWILYSTFDPFGCPKKTTLKLRASYHPHGDWQMRVIVGRTVLLDEVVSYKSAQDEWMEREIDLSEYAKKREKEKGSVQLFMI